MAARFAKEPRHRVIEVGWGYVFHPGSSHKPSAICVFHGKIGSEGHSERDPDMLIHRNRPA